MYIIYFPDESTSIIPNSAKTSNRRKKISMKPSSIPTISELKDQLVLSHEPVTEKSRIVCLYVIRNCGIWLFMCVFWTMSSWRVYVLRYFVVHFLYLTAVYIFPYCTNLLVFAMRFKINVCNLLWFSVVRFKLIPYSNMCLAYYFLLLWEHKL